MIKFPDNTQRKQIKENVSRALKSLEAVGQFRAVKVNVDIDPA